MTLPHPNLAAWRGMIVGFTAVVTGGTSLWLALRPSRKASRLGMRGLKRQRALLDPFWASVEPLVRWAGVRVSGVLDDKTRNKMDLELTHAGDFLGITVDEYLGMILLTGVVGAVVGVGVWLFFEQPVGVPLCAAVGAVIPRMVVDNARATRFCEMNRGLPYAIDLMSLSMSAGLDFPGAVHQVVSKGKANIALRDELGYMLQQFQLGRTRAQVLKELFHRVPIEAVGEFVNALLQAEERGTPVAAVLEIQATTARVRRSNLAENAAEDMKTKMVIPMFMLIAVSLGLVMIPTQMMMDNLSNGGLFK
jgi:tight adherence protein C